MNKTSSNASLNAWSFFILLILLKAKSCKITYLFICFTCLPACLPTCMPAYLPFNIPTYLFVCFTCLPAFLLACLPIYHSTYLPIYLPTCLEIALLFVTTLPTLSVIVCVPGKMINVNTVFGS